MRKIFFTILLGLLITPLVISQEVRYGAKIGVQKTNIYSYHPVSSSRYGFQAGLYAQIPIGDTNKWLFQPEIIYLNHGERNDNYQGVTEKYNINYVAVPLMIKRFLSDYENTFFVEVGPQVAFKISQNTIDSDTAYWESRTNGTYGKDFDDVALIDISLGLGFGYSLNRELDFGLRLNYGLTDAYPNAIGEAEAKTNGTVTIAFSIGYIFR